MRATFKKLQESIRLLFFVFSLRLLEDMKEEPCYRTIAESYRVQWEGQRFWTEVVSDKR